MAVPRPITPKLEEPRSKTLADLHRLYDDLAQGYDDLNLPERSDRCSLASTFCGGAAAICGLLEEVLDELRKESHG